MFFLVQFCNRKWRTIVLLKAIVGLVGGYNTKNQKRKTEIVLLLS